MKNKHLFRIYSSVIIVALFVLSNSCKKEEIQVPVVNTSAVTAITSTTAICGGNATGNGGATIISRGVCWSTGLLPTISDSKTINGTGTGSFVSSLTDLLPGTTYYIRAYATNSAGTGYGNKVTAITTATIPVLTTSVVSALTESTATSGGNVTSEGGSAVWARGVCWSTSQNPTITDNKSINGTGLGIFTSSLTGLTPGATYYIRAYAINSIGTAYGNQETATTLANLPTLTTTTLSSITTTTATSGGNITSDGGAPVTDRGVCWSTSQNPTTSGSKVSSGTGTGIFTSSITGLVPGTTYYVKAYATNSAGTAYGNQVSAVTTLGIPTITTAAITAITETTATSGGNITADGGAAVFARGVCWSTSQNPTIDDSKTINGTGTGSFVSSISGLTPGATYYVRAYATNSVGTAYGNQLTSTTLATLPVITTVAVTAIAETSATSGGNISSDGGSPVTARGVCWGINQNPTISDSKTSNGTGTGSFVSSIIDLVPGRNYYIRAYATNSVGTSYGNQIPISTLSQLPTITTTDLSSITATSAISGGYISFDGGSPVTARGVCWSTAQNPTIANFIANAGTGVGTFNGTITGLSPGTTYYVRAFATNSAGTGYGAQLTLTTLTSLPTVTTNAITSQTAAAATCGGNITNDGGLLITERGVCWSTSASPTTADSKTSDGTGPGVFTSSITELSPITTYFVRAYATNALGTAYGNQVTTTTLAFLPILTTTAISSITASSAITGGNISNDGGASVIARGVCWSTNTNPTISDSKTTDGTGQGSFTSNITGLEPGTTYFVRAYATNSSGTNYGNQIATTTLTTLSTVSTTSPTSITTSSATGGGNITSDGGSSITSRGVCWSLQQYPTIEDSKTINGTGTGSFVSSITGLAPFSTYYIRAYATNGVGTSYGFQISFTTLPLSVSTTTLISFTFNTATISGNVSSDDGSPVTERGIYYGTSTNPQTTGIKLQSGTGTGLFTTTLTELNPNISYYATAYSTNGSGTTYANEVTFVLWINQPGPVISDFDGNTYNSVKIGNQIWMTENLKTTSYKNGQAIGTTTPETLDISAESSPKYQWVYGANATNLAAYGRLYTWHAVTDTRGVCPDGWHVPSQSSWETLANYLGGRPIAGGKLKEGGLAHWQLPNTGATNEAGFTALPGGYRYVNGTFSDIGNIGYWWSSTGQGTFNAWGEQIGWNASSLSSNDYNKPVGHSIRCIKD